MYEDLKGKPRFGNYILVEVKGDLDNAKPLRPEHAMVKKNRTNVRVLVFNLKTNRYSEKYLFASEKGLYFRGRNRENKRRYYLSSFGLTGDLVFGNKKNKYDWVKPIFSEESGDNVNNP